MPPTTLGGGFGAGVCVTCAFRLTAATAIKDVEKRFLKNMTGTTHSIEVA
jgi:hypothetical protein